ncbi:MAG: N-acetylmuramoyl-L-alanine amidase [Gammaproteobacteria bacterium]|nr:MAG: N-acetylmuramoyl-L-alanine amidase [Gammaproteobacteria bacterium]
MKRIIMHWTAGTHNVSKLDRTHYHYIVDGNGEIVEGIFRPEDNIPPLQSGRYAAHTWHCNSYSIGVSMAAMFQARQYPFDPGPYPITDVQLESFIKLVADLSAQYDIPVTRETILSHAEVEPTLGVRQRKKWDITWLPEMAEPMDPVEVGDRLRGMISNHLRVEPDPEPEPTHFWEEEDWMRP